MAPWLGPPQPGSALLSLARARCIHGEPSAEAERLWAKRGGRALREEALSAVLPPLSLLARETEAPRLRKNPCTPYSGAHRASPRPMLVEKATMDDERLHNWSCMACFKAKNGCHSG